MSAQSILNKALFAEYKFGVYKTDKKGNPKGKPAMYKTKEEADKMAVDLTNYHGIKYISKSLSENIIDKIDNYLNESEDVWNKQK